MSETSSAGHINHRVDFDTLICPCGMTAQQIQDERAARHAARTGRRPLTEAEKFAQDKDKAIKNESRRDRRRFHGSK